MVTPKKTLAGSACLLLAVASLCGCGPGARSPGPSASERGRIVMWSVPAAPVQTNTHCSDKSSAESGRLLYTYGAVFAYKVSADGATATAESCTGAQPSTCQATTNGVSFAIAGHALTFTDAPQQQIVGGSSCLLQTDQKWTLQDKGETISGNLELDFSLVGDAADCAGVEEQAVEASINGYGLQGCSMAWALSGNFLGD